MADNDQKTAANQALAAEIRAERAAVGITVRELALRSGVPYGTLNRILPGERDISFGQLTQLAGALGVTPSDLSERAVRRMGGMDAVVSGVSGQNVTPLRRVEDMTVDEIEAEQKKAATIDPEMDTDEQFD
ncbi:helix-turn-helix transcriptional regulator [Curtobacterium sp. PhB25]|uniref:helix-turn-helix domain-containing protein n=1 Tax=Curtobacterium sp. PhB25 TaxID=2485205 RepID=UPI001417097A|nr:helix-turn-helix transcriptional regulator [Curtobacterium sp. PhB25]